MRMFTKKTKPQYHLDIKTYSIDEPKILKPKKNLLQKTASTVLATLLLGITLTSAVVAPAVANPCFMDASDNEGWVGSMGGMLTTMVDPASNNKTKFFGQASTSSLTDAEKQAKPTMRDKYGDTISFVSWYPAIRDEGSGTKPADLWAGIYKSATWADEDRTKLGFGTYKTEPSSPIREGEVKDHGPLGLTCFQATTDKAWTDVAPNFFFQIAKGINNITTFLYVNASTGSNISDVVGLNNASVATSPDQILERDSTQNTSWAYNFGSSIQEVLTGTSRDGTPTGTQGLYNDLYLNFLLPIILIGTVVILFNAIRSRAIKALSGIVWMIVAVISGILLLQRPMMIPEVVDGLVGTVSSEVNRAIIGTQTTNKACDIPDNLATGEWASPTKRQAKEMECYIWYYTIYVPWAEGQFGVQNYDKAANNYNSVFYYETAGNPVLEGESGNIPIGYQTINAYSDKLGWPLYMLEYMERPQGANVAIAQSQAIENNIGVTANGGPSQFFSGGDRIGSSLLALAVSLSAGIFISTNSALIIGYQIAMLLLLMVAPVFLLIGAIPSQMGKGIGLRWAELVVGIAVKRMVIVILMAVFIKMFIIVAGIDNVGVGFQIIIFSVLSFLGITKRKEIMDMFTGNINFGGNKSFGTSGVENIGNNLGRIAVGGAIAGAAAGGRLARKGAGNAVKASAGASARGIKNASYNQKVKSEQRKLFGMENDEQRQAYLEKKNKKRIQQDKADTAMGRRYDSTNGSNSSINEQGRRKLRNARTAAKATVYDQFKNGEIDFNDSRNRPPKMKEVAWQKIKKAPAKVSESTNRTIDAAKTLPTIVQQSAFETKEDIKDLASKTAKVLSKDKTQRNREVYLPKRPKLDKPKKPSSS